MRKRGKRGGEGKEFGAKRRKREAFVNPALRKFALFQLLHEKKNKIQFEIGFGVC